MARSGAVPVSLLLLAASLVHAAQPPQVGLPFDSSRGYRDCAGPPARVDVLPVGGRVLHAEPNDRSARVGRLSASRRQGRRAGAPITFPLTGSFDGWLLFRDANAATGAGAAAEAWILGRGVSTGVRVAQGYSHPSASSRIVIHSIDRARLDAHAELIDIIACDGGWIYGRWRIDEPARLSWLQEIAIWSDPPVLEFWTPACDRRSRGCDTPPGTRPRRAGARDPIPQ